MNNKIENNQADRHLVDKILDGDTRSFEIIIKNTEAMVAQIVFKMIPGKEDRKDIAQDIYLKAFHKLSGFKFQSKLSTWIAQVAYNTCLNYLEKKKLLLTGNTSGELSNDEHTSEIAHSRLIQTLAGGMEKALDQKELSSILQVEIDKLPPVYKTLITLYHHETLSYEEIGRITNLLEGTLKNYLFRARKLLKENLLATYKKEEL